MVLVIITFPMIIFQINITVWYMFIGFLTFCSAFLYITRIIRQNRLFWAFCPLLSLLPCFPFIYRSFRWFCRLFAFSCVFAASSFIYRIFRWSDIFIVAECVFYFFLVNTRVFIWLSRSSVRFYLVFTNLPVFTAFQHVFLYSSVFQGFSRLFPLIYEFLLFCRAC